ncbi:MAG TPA: molybdopterin-synthase adenylyltransferase MoeB [Longimicrobiales bacterium]|nr:molybdopterin-synthase adenylyltransferase MoeB [Longimicrobiales bacterium]
MSVPLAVPTPLRPFTGDAAEVRVDGSSVGEALADLTRRHPRLRRHLYTDAGALRAYVNVFRNDEDVRALEGEATPLRAGDTLSIVPSVQGGRDTAPPAEPPPAVLSQPEMRRYARHLVMPEVGLEGQRRLKEARVLLVGAGGLGSPAALYLAAAGVGTLGLVDFDVVDESNLQRQVLYGTADVERPKLEAARERLEQANPHVRIVTHETRLTSANALELLEPWDVVVDGSDNFPTRYLVNDACVLLGKPNVYGSIFRFEGQLSVFWAGHGPCYRCLFREPPPPGLVPSCAEGGVLGVLPGIIGSLQAMEAIKLVLDVGEPMLGRILLFDALAMRWRELKVGRNPDCPVCGDEPTQTGLIDYEDFCGLGAGAGGEGAGRADAQSVPQVTATEVKERLDRGDPVTLVDVREPREWQVANLGAYGARLLPMGDFERWVPELDPAEDIVVYCRSGARSDRVALELLRAGYPRVANLEGGILAWAREVDPSLPGY